jgi:glycosyltransferase involved in cell wall biosynthesis
MRIEFIVPAPFTLVTGGYEYDRRITQALRDAGHSVTIHELAGRHPDPDDAAHTSARAVWAALPGGGIVVIDNLALLSFASLAEELGKRGVVVLNHHPLGLETGLDAERAGKMLKAERALSHQARHIITTSPTTSATVESQFGIAAGRISAITPGTAQAPRSTGSGTSTVNILSIGTLIPRKGHDILLRALAKLFDLDWHLTIAGSAAHDPATASALHAMPQALGISERVTFLGEMTGAPLAQLWQSADLFALATRYEGFGMVITEALRRGLVVAVGNGGAAGALVQPEFGVVCPVDDVAQLSKSLRRLIFDTNLRRSMSDAAWAFGQTLADWPEQAALFATTLERTAS